MAKIEGQFKTNAERGRMFRALKNFCLGRYGVERSPKANPGFLERAVVDEQLDEQYINDPE